MNGVHEERTSDEGIRFQHLAPGLFTAVLGA